MTTPSPEPRLYVVNLSSGTVAGGPTPPNVQHCNRDTDYEMIIHAYDPTNCEHCAEILSTIEALS